ncbi:hypothetical protein VT50_0216610 [Streptomyces antioxidans]|uniref:Uncharacterized protein n=1 Tax=Streptomyces antioxidans TaxID=1507734 RepID=A0A1V4D4N5_9ACTN|nr:hypothetical protein [Streptomyces antioxidans]OPF79304.1 hypothetical protein VT50_0216610 [Streptomyces antioxidans]
MLNRIRRAVSLTRARHFSKGRHRRPLTPSRPPVAPAFSARADEPTLILERAADWAWHRYSLAGEETALVRPYVLAWERRARQHPTVVVAPHLPTEARSALLEAR